MRLTTDCDPVEIKNVKEFSEWILNLGDGKPSKSNDGETYIEFPNDILFLDSLDPITSLYKSVYPSMIENMSDEEFFRDKAILCPINDVVEKVNNNILELTPRDQNIFLSSNRICYSDSSTTRDYDMSIKFLNSLKSSGLPNHVISLKQGVLVMHLRNIDLKNGLCNGTKLQITQMGKHVLEAKIITDNNIGAKVFLPRMVMSPTDSKLPFRFHRRQFPIMPFFGMIINKSQGQSLAIVGVYLPRSIFTHGQLYVVVSRVKSKGGLKILITDEEGNRLNFTRNVVYKEIFQNL